MMFGLRKSSAGRDLVGGVFALCTMLLLWSVPAWATDFNVPEVELDVECTVVEAIDCDTEVL